MPIGFPTHDRFPGGNTLRSDAGYRGETEIAGLKTENKRLERALAAAHGVPALKDLRCGGDELPGHFAGATLLHHWEGT